MTGLILAVEEPRASALARELELEGEHIIAIVSATSRSVRSVMPPTNARCVRRSSTSMRCTTCSFSAIQVSSSR